MIPDFQALMRPVLAHLSDGESKRSRAVKDAMAAEFGLTEELMGAQGDRGVFITTSSFSSGAREEAERVAFRIELIDGARLAQLMLRHGVGVQAETTATLYQLDEDFFEAL